MDPIAAIPYLDPPTAPRGVVEAADDVCPECEEPFQQNTRSAECATSGHCAGCCVEHQLECDTSCAQLLAQIADEDAFDAAYDREYGYVA